MHYCQPRVVLVSLTLRTIKVADKDSTPPLRDMIGWVFHWDKGMFSGLTWPKSSLQSSEPTCQD